MTNCHKRILLPLLIDKWQIATKEYFYHYKYINDKLLQNNTFTSTNRSMTNCYKRILLPLLIDKWQIATKEYFYLY